MPPPRVSIITPCYNVAPYVERMISSVRAQTFADWEHILVDDGSTDHTADVIEAAIEGDHRCRLVRQTNAGVCAARNAGYRASIPSSEYVYFPDPDDMLRPELLEVMIGYMDAHPGVGLAYCDYVYVNADDCEIPTHRWPRYAPTRAGVRRIPEDEPLTPFASVYCWAPIPEPVAVMRRAIYDRTTGWDVDMGQHGEGVILFPQFALYGDVHFVPQRLYRYRRRPGQSSGDAAKQARAEGRVVEWWSRAAWLTPEQRRIVGHAEWFRAYRLEPWKGIRAAWGYLRAGRLLLAARFAAGAGRRYAQSFVRQPGASTEGRA